MKRNQKNSSSGFKSLDRYYSVQEGQLTVVTGISNVDTKSFVHSIMMNLAKKRWKFAVFSEKSDALLSYLGEFLSNKDNKKLTPEEVEKATKWYNKHFFFPTPESKGFTVDTIINEARRKVMREDINGLCIDAWGLLDHKRPPELKEAEYIFSSITKLRQFADMYSLHVFIIFNPTNLLRDEAGNFPVTTPYDIHNSGLFVTKVENCLALFRYEESDSVDIHIQKSKICCSAERIELVYNADDCLFEDIKKDK